MNTSTEQKGYTPEKAAELVGKITEVRARYPEFCQAHFDNIVAFVNNSNDASQEVREQSLASQNLINYIADAKAIGVGNEALVVAFTAVSSKVRTWKNQEAVITNIIADQMHIANLRTELKRGEVESVVKGIMGSMEGLPEDATPEQVKAFIKAKVETAMPGAQVSVEQLPTGAGQPENVTGVPEGQADGPTSPAIH